MQAEKKRMLITGTNRGLGKSLVELLHEQHHQLELHITSRNPEKQYYDELKQQIPNHNFITYQLEISSDDSIKENAQLIKNNNILFNYIVANAGFGWDPGFEIPSQQTARKTLSINVNATINFIRQFLPLLSPTGRLVIISSEEGALIRQSPEIQEKMQNPNITEEQLLNSAQDYIQCAAKGDMKHYHWSAYGMSKVIMNAWTRFILPTLISAEQTIVCVDPGWCKTDMGTAQAPLSARDGANRIKDAIWLKQIDHTKIYNQKYCDYFSCS